jgi:hypothetical protein
MRECVLEGCHNTAVIHSRFCDRHRRSNRRPTGWRLKEGAAPALPGTIAPGELEDAKKEVQRLARSNSLKAIHRLVQLLERGATESVQANAAFRILGLAGIPLAPPPNVKVQHELPRLPPSVSVADLVALVRGSPGAMAPQPRAAVEAPALPPSGACDAQFVEMTEENGSTPPGPPGLSGPQPEVPAGGKEA